MSTGNERATSENSPAKAEVIFPSEVSTKLSVFDRFATYISARTSQAWFFVVVVVLWAPSFFLLGTIDTWQLIINTVTTIVTFLLVALLQNTQKRSDDAVQHKLNAVADGLADLMKQLSKEHPELDKDLKELRMAVGLEDHESAS
ncbi:low affinity iron permease family protein [Rhodococcus sp. YH3-3]|uniref:low affinity iron permease family protein n=1 Tax=Rhodococcus sp. YH3-3 TaxID=1803579 RepID=UPI0007DAF06F|nr:low affinity iron permease family protein [Rhodococcus sp. YH3-3]